jgi:REP element-mobilizing transposase RayT
MPDHVHLVIRKHRDQAEDMIAHFQEATRALIRGNPNGQHGPEHPVWGGPGWKVFLNSQDDIRRTIYYVEQNPVKMGRPVQAWHFVKPYDGWLPGRGPAKPQAEGGVLR